ncbi:MAG: serpin family protein [Sumerlaeia bacterium]
MTIKTALVPAFLALALTASGCKDKPEPEITESTSTNRENVLLAQASPSANSAQREPGSQPATRPASQPAAGSPAPPVPVKPKRQDAAGQEVQDVQPSDPAAFNGFAFDLLREVAAAAEGDENVLISPASISTILALVADGARGTSREQMLAALGVETLPEKQPFGFLNEAGDVDVNMANAVWVDAGYSIRDAFAKHARADYGAEIGTLELDSDEAAKLINAWVKDNTNEMIESLVDGPLGDDMRVYLANAVAFEGKWRDPFQEAHTKDKPFHLANGDSVQVPLMTRTGMIRYTEAAMPGGEGQVQVVELEYGEGGGYSMIAMLPPQDQDVVELVSSLDAAAWEELTGQLRRQDGTVTIPRLEYSFKKILNQPLQDLGMTAPFHKGQANFDGMGENLFIGEVVHKAYIEMNEEGTRAAAATGVGMRATSASITPPFHFLADRPYVYFIATRGGGAKVPAVLFSGVVKNPKG